MTDDTLFLEEQPATSLEPPVGTPEEEEGLRLQAEASGELDYIIPELRHLAVRVIRLNLDPINAQEHDKQNIEVIVGSLQMYGQRLPITVNWEDTLIPNRVTAGNGRLIATKMLSRRWIAAVSTRDNETEAIAWGHVDNRSSALARVNYQQASSNMRALQAAGHPLLQLMYDDAEALPLLREDFAPVQISDEKFDATVLRGRAINKITAAERVVVDQAIEVYRKENTKSLTEGACLEAICREYMIAKGQAVIEPTPQQEEVPVLVEEEEFLSLE